MTLVRSLMNVKIDGKYRNPGSEWDCHPDQVGGLVEIGSVEVVERDTAEADTGMSQGLSDED